MMMCFRRICLCMLSAATPIMVSSDFYFAAFFWGKKGHPSEVESVCYNYITKVLFIVLKIY